MYAGIVLVFNNVWILYQPYFELTNIDVKYFGILFASFNISCAIFAKYSHKIEKQLGQKLSLIFVIVILGISHLLIANIVTFLSFLFLFIHQFVRSFYKVVISDYVNQLTKSDVRATVLSINNMVKSLMYAAFLPFLGVFTDTWGILTTFNILGILTILMGGSLLLILKKNRVI